MSRLDKIREWQAEMGSDACAQCDYLLSLTDKLLAVLIIIDDRALVGGDIYKTVRAAIEEARK